MADGDFKDDVTGTSWRRREGFGGLLAARLAALSKQAFESYSIYRRPEVYVALPQFFAPGDSRRNAKFFFNLDDRAAHHGFWIEKSDEAMDATWDWLRFTAALTREKRLQAQTLVAMQRYGLAWSIDADLRTPKSSHNLRTVTADTQGLRLQGKGQVGDQDDEGDAALSWAEFFKLLAEIPADHWCDLYLAAHVPKARAVERGVELGQEAATIYHALAAAVSGGGAAALRRRLRQILGKRDIDRLGFVPVIAEIVGVPELRFFLPARKGRDRVGACLFLVQSICLPLSIRILYYV